MAATDVDDALSSPWPARRARRRSAQTAVRNSIAARTAENAALVEENTGLREIVKLLKGMIAANGAGDELDARLAAVKVSMVQHGIDCRTIGREVHFAAHAASLVHSGSELREVLSWHKSRNAALHADVGGILDQPTDQLQLGSPHGSPALDQGGRIDEMAVRSELAATPVVAQDFMGRLSILETAIVALPARLEQLLNTKFHMATFPSGLIACETGENQEDAEKKDDEP